MLLTTQTHQLFNENVLNLLHKKCVYTVLDFLSLENRLIERYTALTYQEIIEAKKDLAKAYSAPPINALTWYQNTLTHSALISTGLPGLDSLLGGGLFTGTHYEICGAANSRKLLLLVTILKNVLCGGNQAYILDTYRDFSAKLIRKKLAETRNQEGCLELLKKLFIMHISNKYQLISALFAIKRELETGTTTIRLIIIYSLSALILSTTDTTENNHILNHLANILRYLARKHNITVITTNLVTTWAEGFYNYQEGSERTACGKYWQEVPNVRIKLDWKTANQYEVKLMKFNNVFVKEQCLLTID